MMDKSREAENNNTLDFKDSSQQREQQQNRRGKLHQIKQMTAASPVKFVNIATWGTELS